MAFQRLARDIRSHKTLRSSASIYCENRERLDDIETITEIITRRRISCLDTRYAGGSTGPSYPYWPLRWSRLCDCGAGVNWLLLAEEVISCSGVRADKTRREIICESSLPDRLWTVERATR